MSQRVLVGHGDESAAESVVKHLVAHGYDAVAVRDGHALLDMADAWSPTATIVERDIPGRSAMDLGRALRHRFQDTMRLVALAASDEPRFAAAALEAGYDDVVLGHRNPGDLLIALGGPGAELVRRARSAMFETACTMIEAAHERLKLYPYLPSPDDRRRALEHVRKVVAWLEAYAEGSVPEPEKQSYVEFQARCLATSANILERGAPPGSIF